MEPTTGPSGPHDPDPGSWVGPDSCRDPGGTGPPQVDYGSATAAERSDAVLQLSGLMAATHAELLRVITAVVAGGDWHADGATDPAAWLVASCGLTRDHAREWVRVAAELEELPLLRAAFASGRLSWDQIRPATSFATPDTDAAVLAEVEGLSARQVAILARQRQPITRDDAADVNRDQTLRFRPDRHRPGMVRLNAALPADVAASIASALDHRARRIGPDSATGRWDPIGRRRAQALHDLATADLGTGPTPDTTCVVIHADVEVIDGSVGGNAIIAGPTLGDAALSRDGVLRALCDCRVEAHLHDPASGATVGVSRVHRTIPHHLRRVVLHRDGTCRFPGCERQIRQIHHIWHWAKGGPTDVNNLIGVCWAHHDLVHEGGWTIWGNPDGEVTFVDRNRIRRWSSHHDPVRPSTRRLLDDRVRSRGPGRRGRSRHSGADP